MKVLIDSCVWGGVRGELAASGHDVAAVSDFGSDPGDEQILEIAHKQGRILVTLDKDFGELAVVRQIPHSGIVRLVDVSARRQGAACHDVLVQFAMELSRGAIVTAEPGRIRVRSGESP